jgi:hypothetical protein
MSLTATTLPYQRETCWSSIAAPGVVGAGPAEGTDAGDPPVAGGGVVTP